MGLESGRWPKTSTWNISLSHPAQIFNFFDGLRSHDYAVYFGLRTDQFDEVYRSLSPSGDLNKARKALPMPLVYMRLGISQDPIASMFKTFQSNVSRRIAEARDAVMKNLVPRFLGYRHITRQHYIRDHSTTFSHRLTASDQNVAIGILNGTYIYCQKSR